MKDCLSLSGLGSEFFSSLRTEKDEPIYTNNDKRMRNFLRQSNNEDEFVLSINTMNQKFAMTFLKSNQKK